jgi:hypothetical protein
MKTVSAMVVVSLAGLLWAKPTMGPDLEKMIEPQKAAEKSKDQRMDLGQVDVNAWIELYRLVGVTTGAPIAIDDIKIDRDFKEYLVQTVDRESVERANQEN